MPLNGCRKHPSTIRTISNPETRLTRSNGNVSQICENVPVISNGVRHSNTILGSMTSRNVPTLNQRQATCARGSQRTSNPSNRLTDVWQYSEAYSETENCLPRVTSSDPKAVTSRMCYFIPSAESGVTPVPNGGITSLSR